jgi:hypothetical protein
MQYILDRNISCLLEFTASSQIRYCNSLKTNISHVEILSNHSFEMAKMKVVMAGWSLPANIPKLKKKSKVESGKDPTSLISQTKKSSVASHNLVVQTPRTKEQAKQHLDAPTLNLFDVPLEVRYQLFDILLYSPCEITIAPDITTRGTNGSRLRSICIMPIRTHLGILAHTSRQLNIEIGVWIQSFLGDPVDGSNDNDKNLKAIKLRRKNQIILTRAFGVVNRELTTFRIPMLRSSGTHKWLHRVSEWRLQYYQPCLSKKQIINLEVYKYCMLATGSCEWRMVERKAEEWFRRGEEYEEIVGERDLGGWIPWHLSLMNCRRICVKRVDLYLGGLWKTERTWWRNLYV